MSLFQSSPKELYAALLARDPAFDGHMFVGVSTTGIFCRFTCPARKPLFENTQFFETVGACLQAGFRPCLRCRPLEHNARQEPLVAGLLQRLEADPQRPWAEADLLALQLTPSTVRRAFLRTLGISFLELARMRRIGSGMAQLATGAPVVQAQLEAGYDSASGFREAVEKIASETPKELQGRALLQADWIDTPLGSMLAIADPSYLHLLEFFDRKALRGELERLRQTTRSAIVFERSEMIERVRTELARYFAGECAVFQTPLALHGPPFTRRVWMALQGIPPATVQSYRDLAHGLGQPTATRAVARANGANQLAVVIPCHRVLGQDGSLTGYAGGLWRKQWLIEHERRHFTRPENIL